MIYWAFIDTAGDIDRTKGHRLTPFLQANGATANEQYTMQAQRGLAFLATQYCCNYPYFNAFRDHRWPVLLGIYIPDTVSQG